MLHVLDERLKLVLIGVRRDLSIGGTGFTAFRRSGLLRIRRELIARRPSHAARCSGGSPTMGSLFLPARGEDSDTMMSLDLPRGRTAPAELGRASVLPARALLGRYEVLFRIAGGGMGSVYLCRVTGEGGFRRLFALKALRRCLTQDAAATRMFLQEARVAAKIYDPHVVGIVDLGMHASQPYLVMDYVEGCSLQQLLGRHPFYRPPRLIIPLLIDALAGLHAAHTLMNDDGALLELVHCDVSPHNMLVGIDGTCRLSDFGIAKAAALARGHGITGTHGKPGFMSPEQAAGETFDHRSDLFSLGVVMWNALTGERLFAARNVLQAVEEVLHTDIPPPSGVGIMPPACLDAICLKALARDPNARYQSAEEMLHALRTVALREDLLASSADVARWVNATFGEELQARRRAILDASRSMSAAGAGTSDVPEAHRSIDADEPLPSGPASGQPSVLSQTIALPRRQQPRRVVLGAALVSVLVVVFALAWPDALAKLFRVEVAVPREAPSTFEPKLPALHEQVQAPGKAAASLEAEPASKGEHVP